MQHLASYLLALILLFLPGKNTLAWQDAPTPDPSATLPPEPGIHTPLPGQALQGTTAITGFTALEGFQSAELDFAYTGDPAHTWFLIQQSDQPVAAGVLAQWDTTTITDGIYNLRLVVTTKDGRQHTATVAGLRVRNYSPIETDTPTPVTPTATPVPGDTPVPTITATPADTPTATPLPANPAQLSTMDILTSFGKGALGAGAALVLIGLYAWLRKIFQR